MTVAGFYMRSLPSPPAIDFSSPQGKKLFTEALQNGSMEGFFKLISLFQTQSEPAYCGLATLAMVLNALSIDPCRIWKGPWRWFDETMLDWCEPLDKVKAEGISFGKVICLAHCAGANVEAFRTNRSSIDKFRKFVMACATSEDCHLISSYDRRVLKQTGTGHFSPIGGYHAESDMVLILDVARFKYPPHWVPLSILWEAMDTIDEATGLRRGFMLMSKNTDTEKSKGLLTQQQTIEPTNRRQNTAPSFLHTLSCKQDGWISTAKYFTDDAPLLLSSDNIKDTKDVILTIFSSLPSNFVEFIKCIAKVHRNEDGGQAPSLEEKGGLASKEEVLKLLQETSLYKHVTDTLSSESHFCKREQTLSHRDCSSKILIPLSQREPSSCTFDSCHCSSMQPPTNDVLTELLLALPPETWSAIKDENVLRGISGLVSMESLPSLLQDEVLHIRGQLLVLKRRQYDRKEDGA